MELKLETLNACCEVCGRYAAPKCATCPIEEKRQMLIVEAMKEITYGCVTSVNPAR